MTTRVDFSGKIVQSTEDAQNHGIPMESNYTGHFVYDDTAVHDNTDGVFHHYDNFHGKITEFEFTVEKITLTLADVKDAKVSVSDNRVYAIFNMELQNSTNIMGISRIIAFQLGQHFNTELPEDMPDHPKTPIFTTLDKDKFVSTTSHINVHPVGYATGNLTSLIFT